MLATLLFATGFGVSRAYSMQERVATNATMDIGTVLKTINFNVYIGSGTQQGEGIYVVGDFCSWSPSNPSAVKLFPTGGNNWSGGMNVVPDANNHECKLVIADYDNPTNVQWWEKDGANRIISFSNSITYSWTWGSY